MGSCGGVAQRLQSRSQICRLPVLQHTWLVAVVTLSVCVWGAPPPRAQSEPSRAQAAPQPCKPTPSQACGAAAVEELARLYERPLTDSETKRLVKKFRNRQMSLLEMQGELGKIGITTKGVAATYDDLRALNRPVVVRVLFNGEPHFAVAHSLGEDHLVIGEEKQVQITVGRPNGKSG
jgi:hypothetical protein